MPRKPKEPDERKNAPGQGRKKTSPDGMVLVQVLIDPDLLKRMDEWISHQHRPTNRSNVIRDGIAVVISY